MKITISIPDQLFESVERRAKRLGMSRSEIYSKAVAYYLDKKLPLALWERLDEVYGTGAESSQLDAETATIQSQSIATEKW